MWRALRDRQLGGRKFRRQHPIGRYVVDFACVKHRVAIECDGSQHGDHIDRIRQAYIEERGWRVLRFPDDEILRDLEGVIDIIHNHQMTL